MCHSFEFFVSIVTVSAKKEIMFRGTYTLKVLFYGPRSNTGGTCFILRAYDGSTYIHVLYKNFVFMKTEENNFW